MRPTLQYIKEKFEYFNNLCFDGKLKMPPMRLTLRYATMGCTKYKLLIDKEGHPIYTDLSIEISIRRDLPEEEYIDTIVHEMIHYYILCNNLRDTSPHGILFKKKMNEIILKHGIRITIAFEPSDEYMVKSISHTRYICIIDFKDESTGLAVVAKNKVFQYWDAILKLEKVRSVNWYVSNRSIFEKYHTYVTLGYNIEDADKIQHYLTGALEIERSGNVINIKKNNKQ